MDKKKKESLIVKIIIGAFILFFCVGFLFPGRIGASNGGHTGVVTAVEYNSNIIWDSNIVSITTPVTETLPSAPTNLALVANTLYSYVVLNWSDTSMNARYFDVERSNTIGGPYTDIGDVYWTDAPKQEFIDYGVSVNSFYYYRVRATNFAGSSSYSNIVSANLTRVYTGISPTAAPSNLIVTASTANLISVSWQDNSNNEEGFFVDFSKYPSSGFISTQPSSTNTATVLFLKSNTPYYLKVRAYNSEGVNGARLYSAYSNAISVTTPLPTLLPAAPADLSVTGVYPDVVNLQWTDNSGSFSSPDNEQGFRIERSLTPIGPWTPIGSTTGDNPNPNRYATYTDSGSGLLPLTPYYYRVKAFNGLGDSAYSNILSVTTKASISVSSTSGSWVVVFTHRGVPFPQDVIDFICTREVIPTLKAWLTREANLYGATLPYTSVSCVSGQFLLSGNLLVGNPIIGEGVSFIEPLNLTGTIAHLETQSSAVQSAKYVSVFHHLPNETQFVNTGVGTKYQFIFMYPWYYAQVEHYPELSLDYGERMAHEFMHNLGASDKYANGPAQACLINPQTVQEYSGYDIMCHRVGTSGSGFFLPPFYSLNVSEPTAIEVGWSGSSNYHPADLNTDWQINGVNEAFNYSSYWKNSLAWSNGPNPIPQKYALSAASLWKNGGTYHHTATPCPQCWVSG